MSISNLRITITATVVLFLSAYVPNGLASGYTRYVDNTATVSAPSRTDDTSSTSTPVIVLPGAPTLDSGTAGDRIAIIAFTAPGNDGGSAITSYTAFCSPEGLFGLVVQPTALIVIPSSSGPASPLTVSGLTNGTTYFCYVSATNIAGAGPISGTVTVTPAQTVDVPVPSPGTIPATAIYTVRNAGGTPVVATSVTIVPATTATPPPVNSTFAPVDIVSMATPGHSISVTFTLTDPSQTISGYWKYGPEDDVTNPDHWYDLGTLAANGNGTGYVVAPDGKSITITLIDGVRGDDDLTADGTITDPGLVIAIIPALSGSVPVPTLSVWALLLLAVSMIIFAGSTMRFRGLENRS